MPRTYDLIKKPQDLTYLSWDEKRSPSGAAGTRAKAREGTGPHAVIYKLPTIPSYNDLVNKDCLCELLSSRLMRVLEIDHAPVTLMRAYINKNGSTKLTWLIKTRNYRLPGQQKASLQQVFATHGQASESALDYCTRNGWLPQLSGLFLHDYLSANRSRTGRQIEVLRTADGNLALAPFLPGRRTFTTSFRMQMWRSMALAPVLANNYLGSNDPELNLKLMQTDFTHVDPTCAASVRILRSGLSDVAEGADLNGALSILKKRWAHYLALREGN